MGFVTVVGTLAALTTIGVAIATALYYLWKDPYTARRILAITALFVAMIVVAIVVISKLQLGSGDAGAATQKTAASGDVVYSNRMIGTLSGWENDNTCTFGSDGYHVEADSYCFAPTSSLSNLDVVVRVKQTSGDPTWGYGIAYRFDPKAQTFYSLDITSGSDWGVFRCDSETCNKLVDFTANSAISGGLNAVNTLEVRAIAADFRFSINGVQVGEVEDATYPSGEVGVATFGKIEAVFTGLTIVKPAVNILYSNSMMSSPSGWANDQHCSYSANGYHIGANYACFAPVGNLNNLDVIVQSQQTNGDTSYSQGIVFRYNTTAQTWYEFDIVGDGHWALFRCHSTCDPLVDFTSSPAVHTGLNVTNILEVRAVGSSFQFWVNGVQVGHADDSMYTSGQVGLSTSGPIESVFTNLLILQPS